MVARLFLSWDDIDTLAGRAADKIYNDFNRNRMPSLLVYAVPNGGIYAAQAVQCAYNKIHHDDELCIELTHKPELAGLYVDDLIETGNTKRETLEKYGEKPFYTLIDKRDQDKPWFGKWVDFPWDVMKHECGPRENIVRILEYIGEDPTREGLKETPDRVIRSYDELFAGYKQDPKDLMKTFEDGICDEMVLLKNIEFCSMCEHHINLFVGKAHIAYLPDKKIIGLSKLARLLEIYARRLQVQERLTTQITSALDTYLQPKGSACVIEAQHSCMQCRGVKKQNSVMVTSSLTGIFREPAVRAEFFHLMKD